MLFVCAAHGVFAATPASRRQAAQVLERMPLAFEANHGQFDAATRFLARSRDYTLRLSAREAHFRSGAHTLTLRLQGSNPSPVLEATDPLPTPASYFLGNRPERWRRNVPRYRGAAYRHVYPGIDLVFYGSARQLEYDFVVAPAADPRRIRMKFAGAESVSLSADGSLRVRAGGLELRQPTPAVYQETPAGRVPVHGEFALLRGGEVGFRVGDYDRRRPLVIDPVVYSTLFGADQIETANAITVDIQGYIWIAGSTSSVELPVTDGAYRGWPAARRDVFIAKLDPSVPGRAGLLYSTYLGGTDDEEASSIFVDPLGFVYVAGYTSSGDFPRVASRQETLAGRRDAFVCRLDPKAAEDAALTFSAIYGGEAEEAATDLAVDSTGRIFIAGYTTSNELPLAGESLQRANRGGVDVMLAVFNPDQRGFEYGTYLGGNGRDAAFALSLDAAGRIYLAGATDSDDFPVTLPPFAAPISPEYRGRGDVFLAVLDLSRPGLDALRYATFFGGSDFETATAMRLGADGAVWLTGYTFSNDFPTTPGAPQSSIAGSADAFLARLDLGRGGLSSILFSTYLGGAGSDVSYGLALDGPTRAWVAGYTVSKDFPVVGEAMQRAYGGGGADAFLAGFEAGPNAPALLLSSYLGGVLTESANDIGLDARGGIHLAGFTQSADFTVSEDAFQSQLQGLADAFLTRVSVR